MSLKKYSYLLCKTELKAKLMAPMIDGDDNNMGNEEKLENNAVGEFKEFLKMSNIRSGGYFTNQILT